MEAANPRLKKAEKSGNQEEKKEVLYKGTPALCLTFSDLLKQHDDENEAAKAEATRKLEENTQKARERPLKKARKKENVKL